MPFIHNRKFGAKPVFVLDTAGAPRASMFRYHLAAAAIPVRSQRDSRECSRIRKNVAGLARIRGSMDRAFRHTARTYPHAAAADDVAMLFDLPSFAG
ncbi:MAG TPA: hypothetical protein VMV69_03290 [Pirellulales bacterium]|nr:hypothetical protein [Pirellulales bacterium]